jgi:hypothetical protein
MGFDLNGAWGPSALRILDFTADLSSQSTTEPRARTMRRSIPSLFPHDIVDQCEPHPCPSKAALSQAGPTWPRFGVTQIPFLQRMENLNLS